MTTTTMEYPRAGAFVKNPITINANPFFEPIAKTLLKKMAPLPYHYHNTFKIKFWNWKSHGTTLPRPFSLLRTFFPPSLRMTFIHYHECLPNFSKIMVICYHSKKLYFQHFEFFMFFKKSVYHAIFFRIFFIKKMVLLLSYGFQTVRFYGIVFESPISRPTLSVFFTF